MALKCSNCHGSEKYTNVEEKTYEEVSDPDEIVDEGPIQTKNNIGYEDCDGFEDLLESGSFVKSKNEEMPPNRQKVMDK
ncbi:hypothetical protein WA026_001425 [Henosepilachna vigintioctopunctata]|uniref:Uncharacterized protein n=1 Tax=Henosepilachna vigintioctopunctata TaxID=420089 RepID=A0AAW1UR54_9CUCU